MHLVRFEMACQFIFSSAPYNDWCTLCVAASFPFIYSACVGFNQLGKTEELVYYSIFIIIFQLGWASVQVSHLSLAADLTPHQNERTGLLTIRYSFTVFANIMVHLFSLILFVSYKNKGSTSTISAEDRHKFEIVALFIVAAGSIFSLIFHAGVRENIPVRNSLKAKENQQRTIVEKKSVLTQLGLYHIMLVYMMSQLYGNQSQVILPMYLEEFLRIEAEKVPMFPLIMFISSSLTSTMFTKALNNNCGRKTTYFIGSSFAVLTSVIVLFGVGRIFRNYIIYAVAALYGVAASLITVTSQGIVADLIGEHTTHGAFVYGLMSFADKLSNGITVMIVQHFKIEKYIQYYRNMLVITCGGSVIIGLLCVVILPKDFKLFGKKIDDDNSATATKIVYCLETDPNNSSNNKS